MIGVSIVFIIVGALFFGNGLISAPSTAPQQTVQYLGFICAAIFICAGVILIQLKNLEPVKSKEIDK